MHCLRVVVALGIAIRGLEVCSGNIFLFNMCAQLPVDHAFMHLRGR